MLKEMLKNFKNKKNSRNNLENAIDNLVLILKIKKSLKKKK